MFSDILKAASLIVLKGIIFALAMEDVIGFKLVQNVHCKSLYLLYYLLRFFSGVVVNKLRIKWTCFRAAIRLFR